MIRIYFLIFLYPITGQAQLLSARVVNSIDKQPISFASVLNITRHTGTNCDVFGNFELEILGGDSVIISCVGFEPSSFIIDSTKVKDIQLNPKQNALATIELFSSKFENQKTLNPFTKCSFNWYANSGAVKQVAQEFFASENCKLMSLKICRGQAIFKPGGKALYRIRLYKSNETTYQPGEDLYDEPIEIKSHSNSDEVDLQNQNIRIPKGKFYIAIEYITIEENKVVENVDYNGKKTQWIYYRPEIGVEAKEQTEILRIWQLTYDNKWIPWLSKRLRISAKVAY